MAALGALAQLADPQAVTQAGAAFAQLHRHELAIGKSDPAGGELLFRPILAGVFVVGQASDALFFHPLHKGRRITLAVEDQGKAMAQRIVVELLGTRLFGDAFIALRHDLLLDDRDQPRIDHLVHDKKRADHPWR